MLFFVLFKPKQHKWKLLNFQFSEFTQLNIISIYFISHKVNINNLKKIYIDFDIFNNQKNE